MNVGGNAGAWRLLNDYKHQDVLPDLLLQEGPEDRAKALAFAGTAQRLGYTVRFGRDVWVLVRNNLQSRPVHFINLPGGRACFVEVQETVVGSVYVTHHFDRDPFLREILEFVESLRQPWLLAGDFNLQVPENWLCEVLCVEGNHWFAPDGATSSRWDGNRLIDYCVSSVPGISCEFSAVRYSDHKALLLSVPPGVGLRGFGCMSLLRVLNCRLRTWELPTLGKLWLLVAGPNLVLLWTAPRPSVTKLP